MWLIAEYEATTLFTLKPATATASGGKTLLVPTPFAIKMALLDVVCRLEGRPAAEQVWDEWLSGLTVALRPAQAVVVNNTFIKVLKPRRNEAEPGVQDAGYFQRTITYREYAQLFGTVGIALEIDERIDVDRLALWLVNINYLGKRGSFMRIEKLSEPKETLPAGFIVVSGLEMMPIDALLTQLDDVGENVSFAYVDIYSDKSIRLGKQRVLHHVALPYRLVASSRSYSHYEIAEGVE